MFSRLLNTPLITTYQFISLITLLKILQIRIFGIQKLVNRHASGYIKISTRLIKNVKNAGNCEDKRV